MLTGRDVSPYWLSDPPMDFQHPMGYFTTVPGRSFRFTHSSHRLSSAYRVLEERSVRKRTHSHEVSLPSASLTKQGLLTSGLPHPICSAFRLSQPLSGLLPRQATGFISTRIRSWALILQSFPLSKSKNFFQSSLPSSCYSTDSR